MKTWSVILIVLTAGFVGGRLTRRRMAQAQDDVRLWCGVCGDVNDSGIVDITDAIVILNWLFNGGEAPTCGACPPPDCRLPATGQVLCFDAVGGVIPCAQQDCPGQDGYFQAGCDPEGRFVDKADGTVTDTCTGLMWQQNTADVNGDGDIDPSPDGGDRVTWCEALQYCDSLTLADHDDWRLPNIRELQSLADYGRFGPAIDPVFGAIAGAYRSSTSCADMPDRSWGVGFYDGDIGYDRKNDDVYYVRAVRRAVEPR